jgi:hypothetical protein
MIYLMGASHMGALVRDWSNNDNTWELFNESEPHFHFFPSQYVEDKDGFYAASIYIVHHSKWWGDNLALYTSKKELAINPGFYKLLDSLKNEQKKSALFVFMKGEEYFLQSTRSYSQDYDFEIPWRTDLLIESNKQVLPFELIEEQIKQNLNESYCNFLAIRTILSDIPIFNVVCPPPTESTMVPSKSLEPERDLSEKNQIVRLKYYLAFSQMVDSFIDNLKITSIHPPLDVVGKNGFLKQEYVSDGFHANSKYSFEVIQQIRQAMLGI